MSVVKIPGDRPKFSQWQWLPLVRVLREKPAGCSLGQPRTFLVLKPESRDAPIAGWAELTFGGDHLSCKSSQYTRFFHGNGRRDEETEPPPGNSSTAEEKHQA